MSALALSRPEYVRRVSFTNLYHPPPPLSLLLEYGVDVPTTPVLHSLSSIPRSCPSIRELHPILKNAASDPNVSLDLLNTSLLSLDQTQSPSPPPPPSLSSPRAASGRHSVAGLSDEELMAMDPQFTTSSKHDLTKFRFDFAGKPGYCPPAPLKLQHALPTPLRRLSATPYPSSNENNYRLVSFLAQHHEYVGAFGRTILITISGRRHSWNALDWILDCPNSILRDGDYLVVASLVLRQVWHRRGPKATTALIHQKGEAMLNYIMRHKGLEASQCKIKLSVEIVVEPEPPSAGMLPAASVPRNSPVAGGKYLLRQLFTQYLPSVLVLGTKLLSLNYKYMRTIKNNLRDLFLLKLSLYAAKYLPVPVVYVGNETKYGRPRDRQRPAPVISFQPFLNRHRQRNSTGLISSSRNECSDADDDDDEDEDDSVTDNENSPRKHIQQQVDGYLASSSVLRFSDLLAAITDRLRIESIELVASRARVSDSVSFDEGTLFRNRLELMGDGIYKVRSLLPSPDPKETTFSKKSKRLLSMSSTGARSARSTSLEPTPQKPDTKKKRSIWLVLGLKKSK